MICAKFLFEMDEHAFAHEPKTCKTKTDPETLRSTVLQDISGNSHSF